MAKDTKERILAAALDLFSQTGYAGANVRELTASLGMVKSSIYKHFENKEDSSSRPGFIGRSGSYDYADGGLYGP